VGVEERVLPWSDSCFVCGDANPFGLHVKFHWAGDHAFVRTAVDPRFEGYPGHVHGGVVTALLDETIGWACSVEAHRMFYTAEITVRFRHPVPGGEEIVIIGRCVKLHRRLAEAEGHIEDRDGKVLVTARGRYFPLPMDQHLAIIPMLKMPGRPATPEDI